MQIESRKKTLCIWSTFSDYTIAINNYRREGQSSLSKQKQNIDWSKMSSEIDLVSTNHTSCFEFYLWNSVRIFISFSNKKWISTGKINMNSLTIQWKLNPQHLHSTVYVYRVVEIFYNGFEFIMFSNSTESTDLFEKKIFFFSFWFLFCCFHFEYGI